MQIFCFVNSDAHLPQFMEGLRLRVKDVDLDDRPVLVVREAKDDKDGVARPARRAWPHGCLTISEIRDYAANRCPNLI